jgi:2-keto-3-deoxy-6-phosphogluconate aldolase
MVTTTEDNNHVPRITGTLRAHSIQVPDVIYDAKGMVVMGRRIKSIVFSTDVAIIRNCNADAVLAVYPFTPQQAISQAIISAAVSPVFVGVGGGTTRGMRSVVIAQDAEAQGAFGVVVNSPMSNSNIRLIRRVIDIPIIATVATEGEDIQARLDAGATIFNVAAGGKTAQVVREIRKSFPKVPIIATGGRTDESIQQTIDAGANSIVYTPPSNAQIFGDMMADYRQLKKKNPEFHFRTSDTSRDAVHDFFELFHGTHGGTDLPDDVEQDDIPRSPSEQ